MDWKIIVKPIAKFSLKFGLNFGLDLAAKRVAKKPEKGEQICADVSSLGELVKSDAEAIKDGTPEQKEKWLRPLIDGHKTGAFGLTEPNAGTDAAGQQTIAVKQEDGSYIVNGSKVFITGGGIADTYVIFAMTGNSIPHPSDRQIPISIFVVSIQSVATRTKKK